MRVDAGLSTQPHPSLVDMVGMRGQVVGLRQGAGGRWPHVRLYTCADCANVQCPCAATRLVLVNSRGVHMIISRIPQPCTSSWQQLIGWDQHAHTAGMLRASLLMPLLILCPVQLQVRWFRLRKGAGCWWCGSLCSSIHPLLVLCVAVGPGANGWWYASSRLCRTS